MRQKLPVVLVDIAADCPERRDDADIVSVLMVRTEAELEQRIHMSRIWRDNASLTIPVTCSA